MTGYSSSIAPIGQWAIEGRLRIAPQRIFVSGDLLTPAIKQTISQAWRAPISNLYCASESLFLGVQEADDEEMTLMDDLNIFEIAGQENEEVAPGEEGRVVITNLYNHTLPIVRYELGDYVVRGKPLPSGFSSIESIRPGKTSDALPVILDDGTRETLTARALSSFYAPGLERAQFIFDEPDRVQIDYVAKETIDEEIRNEFRRILTMKGASKMTFTTRRVPSIAADPKTGKVRFVVLPDSEKQQPLRVENATPEAIAKASPVPKPAVFDKAEIDQSIPGKFERQVEKYPDRLAVKSGDCALTYAALNRAANCIAHALLARCREAPEPIGILLTPGIAPVVAILGILKAGKFYVPLDPGFPQESLAAIVGDAGPRIILTDDIAPATSATDCRTALWYTPAAKIFRPRFAAIGSRSLRSRPRFSRIRRSGRQRPRWAKNNPPVNACSLTSSHEANLVRRTLLYEAIWKRGCQPT